MGMDDDAPAVDDTCSAGSAAPAGVGLAAVPTGFGLPAAAPRVLAVSVEASSRVQFHVQAVGADRHGTARLHSLLGRCPEPQLSAATRDGHPTFDPASRDQVVRWLRAQRVEVEDVPKETVRALECRNKEWKDVCEHDVQKWLGQMERFAPQLSKLLLPYQREGVATALRFVGRMLLADDMGLGKTYQALAVAACYSSEWQVGTPLLLVVPCSLRRQWAEELEDKFPQLSPVDIHIIRTTTGGNEDLTDARVVIISYRLLSLMGKGLCERSWGMVIVDESSRMRT